MRYVVIERKGDLWAARDGARQFENPDLQLVINEVTSWGGRVVAATVIMGFPSPPLDLESKESI